MMPLPSKTSSIPSSMIAALTAHQCVFEVPSPPPQHHSHYPFATQWKQPNIQPHAGDLLYPLSFDDGHYSEPSCVCTWRDSFVPLGFQYMPSVFYTSWTYLYHRHWCEHNYYKLLHRLFGISTASKINHLKRHRLWLDSSRGRNGFIYFPCWWWYISAFRASKCPIRTGLSYLFIVSLTCCRKHGMRFRWLQFHPWHWRFNYPRENNFSTLSYIKWLTTNHIHCWRSLIHQLPYLCSFRANFIPH
jgi:hypothetical protein